MPAKKTTKPGTSKAQPNTARTSSKATGKSSENDKVKAVYSKHRVLLEDSDRARDLFNQSAYGQKLDDGKIQLNLCEGLFLLEKGRLELVDGRGKLIEFESFLTKARRAEPDFWIRYCVFKDMRSRGYIIKTALKFGADFRVYDRGIKPGEDHARWIVYPVHEGEQLTWYDFAAKNRVAHSTKKRLLMGVVDDENDVSYWEIKWLRP
ncbi:tRNA-intron lyase [Candidatus Woesearchaeota archaeon]|nr:tRNA-intron lyase [Candidatus Woesearchaeota archaeon]